VWALGIDEIRRGRRRWRRNPVTGGWEVAVDCWHVSFVDLDGGPLGARMIEANRHEPGHDVRPNV